MSLERRAADAAMHPACMHMHIAAVSGFKVRFVTVFNTDDITVLLIDFNVILLSSYSCSPCCSCSGSNILIIITLNHISQLSTQEQHMRSCQYVMMATQSALCHLPLLSLLGWTETPCWVQQVLGPDGFC